MNDGLNETTRSKLIAVISALFPTAKIYLFGSRARGTHRPTSDIDLAIDVGEKASIVSIDEAKEVAAALNIAPRVDVVDFHRVSDGMRHSILTDGVLWKS